ncbi:agamous-like MADS-box protein AGL36 [Raphanus sativus]|uniref:Agamous-like MADS-box protein AGL36 n=1 Tax=Raphanus sativus TaxID=3726 RepID=A0A9W3CQ47_RAPSA|nr:agamous-like MADS-box protein AGL36 [Raphanus sativus]XP_056853652.1 agamous-like MADS-box protein AGL36 [Raphanus sativus]
MPRGKLKLEPITDNIARNQSFKKRKKGIIKKVNELATLCGVKACAVINSCDNTEPEFSPSKEGAREVCLKFLNVLPEQRYKKMYDQERYLWERIQKGREKLMRIDEENREIEVQEVMFDLLKGKAMSPHHYSDPDASGPVVGDVDPFAVGTEGLVSNPTEVYHHMRQYDGMDMSVNEQAHGGSNDHVHHQNMNLQEPFQYQSLGNFYDQTQPRFNGSSQDMYTCLSLDQGQSSNQYPNQHQSLLMGQPQQMSDVQASVASMDDNSYCYHQLPITSQMPVTTTTTAAPAADLSDHSIDNKCLD